MFQFWPSIVKPILDAMNARRIIEIGADQGLHSRHLAAWAHANGAQLEIVDPEPAFDIEILRTRFPEVVGFHDCPSLDVLKELVPADVVLLDGDHNWYTVYHELIAIYGGDGSVDVQAPITLCHDVEWPYGRRDLYYSPERIPPQHRQEYRMGGLVPEDRGLSPAGMNQHLYHAVQEGGPRNGVRTAIEDFIARRSQDFRVVWLPMLFGLAVIVPRARLVNAPALTAVLDSLELSRPLRNLCKTVELQRVRANRQQLLPVGMGPRPGQAARSFSSVLPDEVLVSLLKGSLRYRYKGRSMLLNPLDMANYLTLIEQMKPSAVIEIGSLEGGRTEWLADTMAALGLEARVISIDLMPRDHHGRFGIDARVGDARHLAKVLPPEDIKSLGHPLLIIEDSAHDEETCTAVLEYFDPLLAKGDYLIVEDGAFRSEGDIKANLSTLSPPSRAIDAFLAGRSIDYEIDEALCDRFGYNATFNINGWLRRR
ncbi:CmcI family methyltransferase [Rhizobium oryziradicis]|nr:CmcI family methyltransferase [Rhizobium oryziradicis]